MQNIKYHIMNIVAVMFFSYSAAATVNQVVKYSISPVYNQTVKKTKRIDTTARKKSFEEYARVFETGFFKVMDEKDKLAVASGESAPGAVSDLQLIGTITGPPSIAMAMIQKKTDKNPEIYKLGSNVSGHKLVGIFESKVRLKMNNDIFDLELYNKNQGEPGKSGQGTEGSDKIRKNFSRAELQQKVFNNMDNAMKGLMAGPYRINDKVEGYRLMKVQEDSVLFMLGARSGDIVKRVNGKVLNSTERLYEMWASIKNESSISIDIDRNGKITTFIFNITQ